LVPQSAAGGNQASGARGRGCRLRRDGSGWASGCRAHDDRRQSLSIEGISESELWNKPKPVTDNDRREVFHSTGNPVHDAIIRSQIDERYAALDEFLCSLSSLLSRREVEQ